MIFCFFFCETGVAHDTLFFFVVCKTSGWQFCFFYDTGDFCFILMERVVVEIFGCFFNETAVVIFDCFFFMKLMAVGNFVYFL